MSLIQVKGSFVPEEKYLEVMGRIFTLEQRKNAIKNKLEKDGFINGSYIRPFFENNDMTIHDNQLDYVVKSFDPETQIFSIELTSNKPLPEGCEVAMAYECKPVGGLEVEVIDIYFSYLNCANQVAYGYF